MLVRTKLRGTLISYFETHFLIFKKYKKTFALFEGSDFDIEAELAESLKTSSVISIANVMQPFLPSEIVAKRHYFETGTLSGRNYGFAALTRQTVLLRPSKRQQLWFAGDS